MKRCIPSKFYIEVYTLRDMRSCCRCCDWRKLSFLFLITHRVLFITQIAVFQLFIVWSYWIIMIPLLDFTISHSQPICFEKKISFLSNINCKALFIAKVHFSQIFIWWNYPIIFILFFWFHLEISTYSKSLSI